MRFVLIAVLLLYFHNISFAQNGVTVSGQVKDKNTKSAMPFVNVLIKMEKDSSFISGTVTNEEGRFTINNIKPGDYLLELSFMGYSRRIFPFRAGKLSNFIHLGSLEMEEGITLKDVIVEGGQEAVSETMDKKIFSITDNLSQSGGSLLQAMQNLPGITVNQEGLVALRGSNRVTVLIDGKQTAITGFGNQAGLDNIPASAVEKVEIINNPSAKYDANGMAGIINIIMKKEKKEGFNGKAGLITGIGALGEKRANLPSIDPQYIYNPKINPSASVNYRKEKVNLFFQGDLLSFRKLNKNEFTERHYNDGETVEQQYRENRTLTSFTLNSGLDWLLNESNSFTFSALYSKKAHVDKGDLPYFNKATGERQRLWRFYETEVNTALTASAVFHHKFKQPGHLLNAGFNFTFDREDEHYDLTNIKPEFTGKESFALIADQSVTDLYLDYIKPLKHGRLEAGTKFRWRNIPVDMQFSPDPVNPVMDIDADGWAIYDEIIPAVYGNYVFETKWWEVEAGLRVEHVSVYYQVDPEHNTYSSDGYNYTQPFPNARIAYLFNDNNRLSFFYNRRVDRPDEGDIRIFPKYDDPEVLKVGNPTLRPQFTQTLEAGYKTSWEKGYLYASVYHRRTEGTITRVITSVPESRNLYSVMQNAADGYNTGFELVFNQEFRKWYSLNLNLNIYENIIGAFSVNNKYPVPVTFNAERRQNYTGNVKLNNIFRFPNNLDVQLTAIYLAPDIIPQGEIASRYSVDLGIKKRIQGGRGEVFANGSDLFNTMRIKKVIVSDGVKVISNDLFETQVVRFGYNYKF